MAKKLDGNMRDPVIRNARIKRIHEMLNRERDASRNFGAKPYGQRAKVIRLNVELERLQGY